MNEKWILPTYGRYNIRFEKGSGSYLWDVNGKKYIDFMSGIGVASIGHAHPKWVKTITNQANTLAHTSNLFHTSTGENLAKKLCEISGLSGVFFSNSGAEANEGLIKISRKYSSDNYESERHVIVTLNNSFHGRTMGALSATGQSKLHKHFNPFLQGFINITPNNTNELLALKENKEVCAILIEVIQGEGGVNLLSESYLKEVQKVCNENGWLLLIDEVQTGIGRTGKWFAYQHYDLKPSAVSFAKGIAGGLPLGGFIVNDKLYNTLKAGDHGSTYGGNLICTAAALTVIDVLQNVIPQVDQKGEYIKNEIIKMSLKHVLEVRGCGLMIGVKIKEIKHSDVVLELLKNGLACITAGSDVIRIIPPLNIELNDINKGLEIFNQVLTKF